MKKWIDISQPLHNRIAVWPGDTPFHYEVSWSKADSGSVNVGKLTMSTHTGTHADAPFHFTDDGQRILDLDLERFIGPARVVDVTAFSVLTAADLAGVPLEGVTRLLLKTRHSCNPQEFPSRILQLDPDVAPFLAEKGILLLGVDIPSVDLLDSKELPVHHALLASHVQIVENLVLDAVEPGDYEFIGLPLPLQDSDGSPIRAVLRPL
ncbi:arylformamidase [Ectobacillus ponti]|uniref:Kynurenine formamidase n=1 Tax=Ectobacillus ponti TaxID=2961894 RepID=A0AA41XBQ5_9BACI|nr:arylformamidase [Ectobacillus ponti]MCP8970728.1 arylformamidase [Ectobacillus ponti]